MDFNKWKEKHKHHKAGFKNPWMGINGDVCKDPVYWCRLHEVWLSEEDVKRKKCLAKPTYDMIGVHKCNCIEKRHSNPFIRKE